MFSHLVKSSILPMAFVCLTGCITKPISEKKIDAALRDGNAVAIFYGTTNDIWSYKGNPNLNFKPIPNNSNDVYILLELKPGTYYYSSASWKVKMDHKYYNTIPNILRSSLGKVQIVNTTVKEKRSRIVSQWYPEEGHYQEFFNKDGDTESVYIVTRSAGYRDEVEYYYVDVPAIMTTVKLNSLNDEGEANFASFELKAGDIVAVDSLLLTDVNGDIDNCAVLEPGNLEEVSCPIKNISLQYMASNYFQLNNFLAKNLSEQQLKKLVRLPIKLGIFIPNNPSGKSKKNVDTYTIYKK